MRRIVHTSRIIAAIAITSLFLIALMILSNYFADKKIDAVTQEYAATRNDLFDTETEFLLLADYPCDGLNFSLITANLIELGNKLTAMENEGVTSSEFYSLKHQYSLLQIKHWLLVKKAYTQCSSDVVPILYFYSNEDCSDCARQGFVLTHLRNQNSGLYIYALDSDLDSSSLQTLKNRYGIHQTPSIVVFDAAYVGYRGADEIIDIIAELE